MYKLIPDKKSSRVLIHDYEFKDFKSFYDLAGNITVPIWGRYSIAVISDKYEDIKEFLKKEQQYSYFMIYIYTPEALIDYMTMYDTNIVVDNKVSAFDTFKELITQKNLLFDKDVMHILYASIEHDYDAMDKALDQILYEFGQQTLIKEKMLTELFMLNKTVYPRQVMLDYLRMGRYRKYKLDKCVGEMGNDIVVGAIVKNLKQLVEEKSVYFKTGKCKEYIKKISTTNIQLMYKIFVVERNKLGDVYLLFELYERGLSSYDIVQKHTD